MKKLFSIVMFLSALSLFAQPAIQFDQTTIDFGNIKEEGGKVSGRFEFTNTGNQNLQLTGVKPGCGCTAAEHTKTEVAPGEKGFIIATYNPYNRPGSFNKNIKVTTNEPKVEGNENDKQYMIYIKGNVEKRAPSKYEVAGYKNGNGDIRIKDNQIKLDMLNSESKSFTIQVTNFSEKVSTFEFLNVPAYISIDKNGATGTLNPGEEKEFTFKYDAIKRSEIGTFKDIINLQTQDSIEPRVAIFVESVIGEDFSKLTPKQLQDAPKAVLDFLSLNFEKVAKNSTLVKEVKLTNFGKNPLIIRQLKSSNSVFSIVSDKMEIPKDSSATLTVTLTAKNRRGVQNATIDIVTNDPANTKMVLNCTGDISQ